MPSPRTIGRAAALALALPLLAAAPAHAERAVALFPGNSIGTFDVTAPGSVETLPVTGLGPNASLRGIDVRPADGQLYGVAMLAGSYNNSSVRTYTIDPDSGAATFVGESAGVPGAGDVPTGVSFNARSDRLRVVNDQDENFRINPNNGAVSSDDANLTPAAATAAVALGYSGDVPLLIDHADDRLALTETLGGVTDLFPLGFALPELGTGGPDAGFDMSPNTGVGFAAMADTADDVMRLYRVSVDAHLVSPVGPIGSGGINVYSLAILPDPAPLSDAQTQPAPEPDPQPSPQPATPEPQNAPARADAEPPLVLTDVERRQRARTLSRGLVLRYSCSEACMVEATLRTRAGTLGSVSGSLPAAGGQRLRLALTPAGRSLLRKLASGARLRITLDAADPAGNHRALSRRVRLVR